MLVNQAGFWDTLAYNNNFSTVFSEKEWIGDKYGSRGQ